MCFKLVFNVIWKFRVQKCTPNPTLWCAAFRMKSDGGCQKGIHPTHLTFPICILSLCSLCSLSDEGAPQASPPKKALPCNFCWKWLTSIFLNALGAVPVWQPSWGELQVVSSKCWMLWVRWNIHNPPSERGPRALGRQPWVRAFSQNLFSIILCTQAPIILLCC